MQLLLEAQGAGLLNGVSIESIINWYGYIMLWTVPIVGAIAFIVHSGKPDSLKGLTKLITKIVEKDMEKKFPQSEPISEAEEEESLEEDDDTEEDESPKENIVDLVQYVGDHYRCSLSSVQQKELFGSYYEWTTDNLFVAEMIDDTNQVKALRVGECIISCNGTPIYKLFVLPRLRGWFGYDFINAATNGIPIKRGLIGLMNKSAGEILGKFLHGKEKKSVQETNFGTTYIEFDEQNCINKMIFYLNGSAEQKQALAHEIYKGVDEFMMQINEVKRLGKPTNYERFWVHVLYDQEQDIKFVDYVAFIKKDKDGNYIFALGRYWRDYATVNEVINNPEQVLRIFSDLISIDPDTITLSKKETDGEEAPKKKKEKISESETASPSEDTQYGDEDENKGEEDEENSNDENTDEEITIDEGLDGLEENYGNEMGYEREPTDDNIID